MEIIFYNIKEFLSAFPGALSLSKRRAYDEESYHMSVEEAYKTLKNISDDKRSLQSDVNLIFKDLEKAKEKAKEEFSVKY